MIQKKLIDELKDYLNKKKVQYYLDSLIYKGLRKDVPQPDGSKRKLYMVSYTVSINSNQFDSDAVYYAYFDDKTYKLLYILGPQSYEKISN